MALSTKHKQTQPTQLAPAKLRRQPQQKRGQQRVDAILDAAETAFGSVGYEATTTNQIAAGAGISIGSIYQFFTNKDAILEAVAVRYAQGFFAAFEKSLPNLAQANIAAIVGALIDNTFAFGMQHIGFVAIGLHAMDGTPLAALTRKFQQRLIDRIALVIGTFAPQLSEAQCKLHAHVAHAAIKGHVAWAIAETKTGNRAVAKQVIEEAKHMQTAYFEGVLARL